MAAQDAPGLPLFPLDLAAPSYLLAGVALVLLLLLAPRRKRFKPTYLLSAILGAGGFLLSGWVGLLTACLAIAYRALQRTRAPWQALLTCTVGTSVFAALVLGIDTLHLAVSSTPKSGTQGDSALRSITERINDAATSHAALWALLALGVGLTGLFCWRIYIQAKYPYRNLGLGASADMMYRGVPNKDLVTLPENQRDPQRAFPAKMREEKLEDQKGICAYQASVPQHPRWEPYRSGVQWEGDHVIPWAAGGATNYANLQILCADCNSAKSDAYGKKAMKKVADRWKEKR